MALKQAVKAINGENHDSKRYLNTLSYASNEGPLKYCSESLINEYYYCKSK
jgi:hypothetical protein